MGSRGRASGEYFIFFESFFIYKITKNENDFRRKLFGRKYYRVFILRDGWCIRGDPGPQIGTLLGNGSCDGTAFHFSFVVDNHPGVVFKVQRDTVLPVIRLPLPDHHCWDNLIHASGNFGVINRGWVLERTAYSAKCLTFFLNSGFPFFTEAMTMSPTAAAGIRFNRLPNPATEMT